MLRSLQRIFLRRVISPSLLLVAFFLMCAILFLTRNEDSDAMCLKNRQLQSASKMDEFKTFIPDYDGCNDKDGSAKDNTKNADKNFEQDTNCSKLYKEIDALRKKLAMYERLNKFMELDSLASKYGSKLRQNILIISDSASGSSLLGELLNQHPNIFYLFEPLESLDYYKDNRPESVYDAMVTHLLNSIFHCNFLELSYFTDFLSYQYSALRHRLSSRAISSPPLCPENLNTPHFSIRKCAPLRPQSASAICRLHKHTVVKTIRMKSIHKLSYLMDNTGPVDYSLKVIHLVRDPRAVVNARVLHSSHENWTIKSVRDHAQSLCRDMLRNIKYAVSAPAWLQGRYTLLRYEDLATNPHQIAEQLYQFVGVGIAQNVRLWIDRTLREGFVPPSPVKSIYRQLSYSAQNLTDSVTKWRAHVPYSIVRLIETECYEVMNLLGYKIVEDEDELRTVSFPLTD